METEQIVAALAVLAAFNERLLEYALGRWHVAILDRLIPFAALALGVAEALAFSLDVLPAEWGFPIIASQVITGVALGMGSNVVHLLMGKAVKNGG